MAQIMGVRSPQTTISFPNPDGNAELIIYSIDGKMVKAFRGLKGNQVEWRAKGQPSGVYVIHVRISEKVYSKKIIISR